MRTEFLFKLPNEKHLLSMKEMDKIIVGNMKRDFNNMDKILVEIFDKRQALPEANPPLRSLGKMSLTTVLQKFR
jgi:hypothetical protein